MSEEVHRVKEVFVFFRDGYLDDIYDTKIRRVEVRDPYIPEEQSIEVHIDSSGFLVVDYGDVEGVRLYLEGKNLMYEYTGEGEAPILTIVDKYLTMEEVE